MLVIVCLTLTGKIVPPGGESFRCIVQYESMDYRFTNYFKSLYLNPVVIIAIWRKSTSFEKFWHHIKIFLKILK